LAAHLASRIVETTGRGFIPTAVRRIGGGCINEVFSLESASGFRCFVKTNSAEFLAMYEAEAEGLAALRAAPGAPHAPEPLCAGVCGDRAYLLLEHIEIVPADPKTQRRLGRELAALHRSGAARFGWHRNNTIGTTPQPNDWTEDWIEFLRDRRLGFQFALAARNGHGGRLLRDGEKLLAGLARFFDRRPEPSLLHGDLWAGNSGADRQGRPVIFDPAVYYGDREADLAMTELFGGYAPDFYAAYRDSWAPDAGYAVRKNLYNLYHVLNHLNLFGGAYASQAEGMVRRLLAELG
jgi:fructosamine-3-kinase